VGIEWDAAGVLQSKKLGLNVMQGDLNQGLPFKDESLDYIFGFSVLEHLISEKHSNSVQGSWYFSC
jgi:hypothetical protein